MVKECIQYDFVQDGHLLNLKNRTFKRKIR